MADPQRSTSIERDVEQAIIALKKGAYLLKYGRRGKPKFCPFRLANDESTLIWYSGKDEKQLKLSHVSKIIPGQRTAIFQRYPRPEKEYQSFSLICTDRSLDLICKDKDEAEVWFVGLKALISRRKWKSEKDGISIDGPSTQSRRNTALISPYESGDTFQKELGETQRVPYETPPSSGFAKAFSDVILYTAAVKPSSQSETVANSLSSFSNAAADNSNSRGFAVDTSRVSLSSALSSSSQGSHDDFDALGDVFIWGEGVGDGMLGGGMYRVGTLSSARLDAHLPKALRSTVVLDVHNIGCGVRHAVLVTKQGELFSWGDESGGRLGHGVEADISHPKLVEIFSGTNIELLSCGEYHTCAVSSPGDIYTWGDGNQNSGLLGHGSEVGYWVPKKISGLMECFHVSSVACGPWHTAVLTSSGQLFTFGDGTFGVLGHGDRSRSSIPREVESLKGLRTVNIACGVWHTAAVVEAMVGSSSSGNLSSGKLFTWGDGDKGRLGHGDQEPRLIPACVPSMVDVSICQVACGNNITVCLSTSGHVYTMGSASYGQLGTPGADGKLPSCVKGKIRDRVVEEIACGSYHVAVLTSKAEVYTWGKGAHGRLGHGDNRDRNIPTLVEALKDKQVKRVVCGSNFTAIICLHTWVTTADNSVCFGCRNQFGFRRKRHNCYNCGLVFCKACSSKKSPKAALAPNINKPYRVCDDCYTNLKKVLESGSTPRLSSGSAPRLSSGSTPRLSSGATPRLSSGSTPKISKNHSGPLHYFSKGAVEKETRELRAQGKLSRVPSAESFKLIENKPTICKRRLGLENTRFTPISSGSTEWGSFNLMKSTNPIPTSKKPFSSSVPSSRTVSRESSPVSRRSSPSHSRTSLEAGADSKQGSNRLRQEVVELRAQVENLTCKSKLLQAELERTSNQLKEVTIKVGEEATKCIAAKEVIKSLSAQLKDMVEVVHLGSPSSSPSGSGTGDKSSNPSSMSTSQLNSPTSAENESNGYSQSILSSNENKPQADSAEWVVQDEPGVFITLSNLPGGGKILRRIRFSRKHFSEKQAENWWTANRFKVYDQYNIKNDAKGYGGVPISQQETSTSGT